MKRLLYLFSFLALTASLNAQTVMDVINSTGVHNTLAAALEAAELDAVLEGDGPFTVFAPTDAAFSVLGTEAINDLLADPSGELTDILLYHVVGGTVLSGDLSNGFVGTVNGSNVVINLTSGVMVNSAIVTGADNIASNGVVHVIDAVLLPPPATVVDIITSSPVHETLAFAVTEAGLVEALQGDGPFTVFAPTDEAFEALGQETIDAVLADLNLLTLILTYHVVGDAVLSTALESGAVTTLNTLDVEVSVGPEGVFVNGAQVIVADLFADNGVVHVIDAVLVPNITVMEVISLSDDHEILEAAIDAAGLTETLQGEGPFTVFAPTDEAFLALGQETIDDLLADVELLTAILLYHVVGAEVFAADLSNGFVATLNGSNVLVNINEDGVFINDAQVIVNDVEATNGVVHVLDAVLLPPPATVVDVILASPVHNLLATAVTEAGLVGDLQSEGPFTVFAPTDEAFLALGQDVLDEVLADEELLTAILTYHVVGGNVLSTDLEEGFVETLNGLEVEVSITEDGIFINQAQVIVADLFADNGVVHVIDAVLLPPVTVVDIINGSEVHGILAAAIDAAELAETLAGEGPFTVFAPTDDAFLVLGEEAIDDLLADPSGLLTDILLYHVVSGAVLSTDLSNGFVATLNGSNVLVSITDDGVFINNAQVIIEDIEADNGVVHVIDAVLLPPPATVVDIILESPVHETLAFAVIEADLVEALQGEGPFTVFAPTDEAFDALPEGLLNDILANAELLANILTYHVTDGNVLSTDLEDGFVTMLNGSNALVTINESGVFINQAQVIIADLFADNGVVHVIDAVITPPPATVVDIIVASPVHTTLAAAVGAAELVETLQGDGPFTVFAPTDEAFNALPEGTVETLLEDPSGLLTDILLYHVVGAAALSTDLSNGQVIETLNGESVTVTIDENGIFINDAEVIIFDLFADNGVVHVIDMVLLPPAEPVTVVDIIVESPVHTTLATAVTLAGLVETLQGEGPFTVFAPTDEAFEALPEGLLNTLLEDPTGALTEVLLYHVVGANVLSTDLEEGEVATLQGEDIVVSLPSGMVMINDATVTTADLVADNGVVHVINAVLTPPTNVEMVNPIADFTLYPNPARDVMTIAGDVPEGAEINIYDNLGRSVLTTSYTGITNINVSDLSVGSYTIMVVAEGAVRVKQFMVK